MIRKGDHHDTHNLSAPSFVIFYTRYNRNSAAKAPVDSEKQLPSAELIDEFNKPLAESEWRQGRVVLVFVTADCDACMKESEFFRAGLSRLKTVGMLDPNELLILHAYLYTPGRVIAPGAAGNSGQILLAVGRSSTQITAAAQLNPALALEFLGLAGSLLLSAPLPVTADPANSARAQLSAINTLMGPLSERLPELALALQSRRQQISTEVQVGSVQPASDFTYGTEGFSLRSAIGAFGPEQFEDVLGIVNRISAPELHGLAILELSRKYLKSIEPIRPKVTPVQ